MKKVLSLYSREMIRPIIYKCVNKCSIALVIVLLWDRYISHGTMPVVRDGCFAAGLVFFALAFRAYLRLDGVKMDRPQKERREKKHFASRDMIDFVDEHIVTFDELDDDQQLACVLASNLFSGLVFLIPALMALAVTELVNI